MVPGHRWRWALPELEVLPGATTMMSPVRTALGPRRPSRCPPGGPRRPGRFREITEAYEVLGHPARRERYDRARRQAGVGTDQASQAPAGSPPGPGPAQVCASPAVTGGPPVFLGTGPVTKPAPWFFVGPAQVGPSPRLGRRRRLHPKTSPALWARLLSDLFEPRWRY